MAEAPGLVKLRPALARLGLFLRLLLLIDAVFAVVYFGCNWLASGRQDPWRIYFDWETRLPFVPGMIWAYFSIVALFALPLFALDEPGLRRLARRILAGTLVAGLAFLLFPARLGFERPAQVPGYDAAFQALYLVDRPHNLVPSLHVVYSALILAALAAGRPAPVRALLAAWLASICCAVVLVHQHHLADVAGGLLVAGLIERRSSR